MRSLLWRYSTWLLLAIVAVVVVVSTQAAELEVHPWCGNNAVVALGRVDFDRSARREWLTGSVASSLAGDRAREIRVALSIRSNEWVEPQLSDAPDRGTGTRAWKLDAWHALVPKELSSGSSFDVRLAIKQRRSEPETILLVTNLVVGPVWLVGVPTRFDTHHLPPISDVANRRVRLLPLARRGSTWESPGWISPRSASTLTNLFSGIPRALAERLARTSPASTIHGLVLVPAPDLPNNARNEFEVERWQPTDQADAHPYLADFVAAAKDSNFDPAFRYGLLQAEHIKILVELKREGRVGAALDQSYPKWTRFAPGDSEAYPLRVHGYIR